MNTGRHIVEMFETCLKDVEEARREFSGALTYSLRLAQISAVKDEILKMACPEGPDCNRFMHDRAHFLTQSCARFQWVVAFSLKGLPVFRVLFDATDIPQGNAVTTIFVENQAQSAPVLELFKLCID